MAVTDSRNRKGTLTLGGDDFACQATAVSITNSSDTVDDPVTTLCGDEVAATLRVTSQLVVEAIQDFEDPDGLIAYSWEHNLDEVAFAWEPNDGPACPTYTGTVRLVRLDVGGNTNERLSTTATWDIVGDPLMVPPVTSPLAAEPAA